MNTNIRTLFALLAVSAFSFSAQAQIILTPTTLSTALTTTNGQSMVVASATPNSTTSQNFAVGTATASNTYAFIDQELVAIRSVSGTTIGIIRGQGGTNSATHASGALVWSAQPDFFRARPPSEVKGGSCTRSTELVLPYINVNAGAISDCLGGVWVNGVTNRLPQYRLMFPDPGGTAYTSINTSGTATIATEVYCTEVNLPYNKLLTGIAILAGTANSTDKHYVTLYDSAGNALANSALAGATGNTTASAYQAYALTSTFFAVGPAQYFGCFQSNGTTDTVRMLVTGVNDNFLTKGQTGATFGTVPALTVPTAFTTAVGPYLYVY